MASGADRRLAQGLLNNFKSKVSAWQRQAEKLPNYDAMGAISLWDYLGISDADCAAYTTYNGFKAAIGYRLAVIKQRADAMRKRHLSRELRAQRRAYMAQTNKGKRKRGRPKNPPLLLEGQYVYLTTAYNHGFGAVMLGYRPVEMPMFDPTNFSSWAVNPNVIP